MHYVLSLSGGTASAVAADRAIERYGRQAVTLWFADTSWEDEDLYRFLDDCLRRWGGEIVRHRDGRTPLEVAEHKKVIPNNRIAPCSYILKILPFQRWLAAAPKPVTVLLGLDWRELERTARPRATYEALPGVTVDYPLLWKPYEFRSYSEVVSCWGIVPPRLYGYGFSHNNCGGRCVRQGAAEWQRLLHAFPERFAEVRDWETAQAAIDGPRHGKAILRDRTGGTLRPLPLAQLEQRAYNAPRLFTDDDQSACFCSVDDGDAWVGTD